MANSSIVHGDSVDCNTDQRINPLTNVKNKQTVTLFVYNEQRITGKLTVNSKTTDYFPRDTTTSCGTARCNNCLAF